MLELLIRQLTSGELTPKDPGWKKSPWDPDWKKRSYERRLKLQRIYNATSKEKFIEEHGREAWLERQRGYNRTFQLKRKQNETISDLPR